jgi:hypothetical protein
MDYDDYNEDELDPSVLAAMDQIEAAVSKGSLFEKHSFIRATHSALGHREKEELPEEERQPLKELAFEAAVLTGIDLIREEAAERAQRVDELAELVLGMAETLKLLIARLDPTMHAYGEAGGAIRRNDA